MAIKKWVWKETAEVLGVVGIIAGIVFLGYELRQNNELMAAEERRAQYSMEMELWGQLVDSPDLIPMLLKDRNGESLSAEEEFRLNAFWMRTLSGFQWAYREGANTENYLQSQRKNFEAYGSLRRTWSGNDIGSRSASKDYFDPEFVQWMEENIVNTL